jgi:hypothetical protein
MTRNSNRFTAFFISISVLLVSLGSRALAHGDSEPLWAMNNEELSQLQKSIGQHRIALLNAMNEATSHGMPAMDARRDYRFDSNQQVIDIPRSVLNRVIMASLALETASMKMYLMCESGCDHSLAKDFEDHAESATAVKTVRRLWPKMKASFAILWKDIPVAVWIRAINAARYSRSLLATGRYQSQAYGRFSMLVGGTAFGAAFAATEVFETMFMGPLHFVCKANYFWSVAFGAAIAGLSRDLKTLLLFEKDGKSLAARMLQSVSNFASLKSAQKIEQRILFRTLAGDGSEQFLKISRRDAHSSLLEPMLAEVSAQQAVAADPLLWSELAGAQMKKHVAKKFRLPIGEPEIIFQTEIDKILDPSLTAAEAYNRWRDLSASMRVVLRIFRNEQEVSHQLEHNRGAQLRSLGRLDMQLRSLDLFNLSWLQTRAGRNVPQESQTSASWLRDVVTEWMALAIETTAPDADLLAIDLRWRNLKAILEASIRRGEPISGASNGPRNFQLSIHRELQRTDRAALSNGPAVRQCEALFLSSQL